MLFLFGVGDTFFSDKSRRCIKRAPEIYSKIDRAIKSDKNDFFGLVRFNEPPDTFNHVDLGGLIESSRIIDVKLCSNNPFGINNQITLQDTANNQEVLLNGDQLDFVIRPEEFDLHIAGIDINGVFIKLIDELTEKGFNVLIYSDAIKPYNRDTIDAIRNSKVRFRKS